MKKQSVQAGNIVCVCCVQVTWWIVWIKRMWRWKWWRWKSRVIKQQITVFAVCRWRDGLCELNGCEDKNGEDEKAECPSRECCVCFAACRWRDGSCESNGCDDDNGDEMQCPSRECCVCLLRAGDVMDRVKYAEYPAANYCVCNMQVMWSTMASTCSGASQACTTIR